MACLALVLAIAGCASTERLEEKVLAASAAVDTRRLLAMGPRERINLRAIDLSAAQPALRAIPSSVCRRGGARAGCQRRRVARTLRRTHPALAPSLLQ